MSEQSINEVEQSVNQPEQHDQPTEQSTDSSALTVSAKPARRLKSQFQPRANQSIALLNKQTAPLFDEARLIKLINQLLPSHYNFELPKTINRILTSQSKQIALQLPEGLQVYATRLIDLINEFTSAECLIMGDVTYGACCVDDYSAKSMGCDMLVHYGHSCLIPIDVTSQPLDHSLIPDEKPFTVMYVFVDIAIDCDHLIETIKHNFEPSTRLMIGSTIQFAASLQFITPSISQSHPNITIPQSKPLSKGEVLGCTSPLIDPSATDCVLFIADGRFHLESMMIQNPQCKFYQYDPYSRRLTVETYDHASMHQLRQEAINQAVSARHWGLVLGTLGRQGNPALLERIKSTLSSKGIKHTVILLSELSPAKLSMLKGIDVAVQVACPRLSVDWGHQFPLPLLNTYEAEVALGQIEWLPAYPMDYYAERGGDWSNYAEKRKQREIERQNRALKRAAAGTKRVATVIAYDAEVMDH